MIEFRIKEKTRSLNESFRGGWQPRAAVAKRQRTKAMQACPKWPGGPLLVVRLTRVSPGTLDSEDNLRGALKHIRDGVASRLKFDDASPLVEWQYHQAKGEAEVVVQIWRGGEDSPPLPVGRPEERRGRTRPGRGTPRGRAEAPTEMLSLARALNSGAADMARAERTPRPSYTPPEASRMHARAIRAAAESIAQAEDPRVLRALPNAKGREFYGQIGKPPFAVRVESSGYDPGNPSVPRGSRTNPMATKTVVPSEEDAAVARAVLAAQEADATFAPGPVPPCDHCGDPYRPQCFDPDAPSGSIKCRKDVHCYRYDGHDGDCSARSPRACTT